MVQEWVHNRLVRGSKDRVFMEVISGRIQIGSSIVQATHTTETVTVMSNTGTLVPIPRHKKKLRKYLKNSSDRASKTTKSSKEDNISRDVNKVIKLGKR